MGNWNIDSKLIWDVLQTMGLLAVAFFQWVKRGDKANSDQVMQLETEVNKKMESLEEKTENIDASVRLLEERMAHLPSNEEVSMIRQEVAVLNTKLDGVGSHVEQTRHALNRIENWLINNK
jgi:uncharacterized protein YhaN